MNESTLRERRETPEGKWQPENIPEQRLRALLPYTGLSSFEELQSMLAELGTVLSRLSVRDGRHKFVARRGGPTKTEYVLYAGGNIIGKDFTTVESALEDLGIRVSPIDELDREFVVVDEVSKVRLEILGLVLGHDPDSEMRVAGGDNWSAAVETMMERAAVEETFDDIPLMQRTHRAFPLKGSTHLQRLDPALRAHFMERMRSEVRDEDALEIDALIDDTAARFEEGSLSLDQAFSEWGVDVDEAVKDTRMLVPAGKSLGEVVEPRKGRYQWKNGELFKRSEGSGPSREAIKITREELTELYALAKPAAELLWDADALSRRAAFAEERHGKKWSEELWAQAKEKREKADALPDSRAAIAKVIEIHSGFVFRRVMRFLKRRDVHEASSFGSQDLMQEGLLGLYKAIARHEEGGNASFVGYARHHIDGMMLSYAVRHRSFVKLPSHLQEQLHKFYDIDDKADVVPLEGGAHSMSPDARAERRRELARRIFGERFDMDLFLDKEKRKVHKESHSYLVPLSAIDDEDLSAVDMWGNDLSIESPERSVDIVDTKHYLSRLFLKVLTPREEMVIRSRFGLGDLNEIEGEKTLEETAAHIPSLFSNNPLTRERVRQIEAKAFRKLKKALYVKFGRYETREDGSLERYVDLAAVARVFDVGGR